MHVMLVSQDFPPEVGGIQTYSYELAIRFAEKVDYFSVLAPLKKGCIEADKALAFDVSRIPVGNTLLPYGMFAWYPALVQKHQINISFHSQWQTMPAAVWSRQKGWPQKILVAAHARELLFNPFGKGILGRKYEQHRRRMLREADHFFPVSHYTAGLLRNEGIPDEKMTIFSNGTDPVKFRPKDVSELKEHLGLAGKKILMTTTRLVSRKGIDTVICSLSIVRERHPDVIYLIVGDGPERENLKELAKNYQLTDIVYFTGKVPYSELTDYYNLCDIFVMPSKTKVPDVEGFGIVFLEAGSCAKPVIGTFSGGIPDAILDKETGLLVEESNVEQLAEAVNTLLDDPCLAKKLGEQGRQRVLKEANWDYIAEKMFKKMSLLYQEYTGEQL